MVAPIDAIAKLQAGDETITLRLNFRAIALAEVEGIDLFDDKSLGRLTTFTTSKLIRCLAVQDQADFDDEQGFALVTVHGAGVTAAIGELLLKASGKGSDAPDPQKAGKRKATA